MNPPEPQTPIITNVADATWKYLWHEDRPRMIMAVSLAVIGVILTLAFEPSLFLFPIVLFIVWYGRVYARLQGLFIQQFADANGFVYCPGETPSHLLGRPFSLGREHTFNDLVRGSIDNLPFEYFSYSYVIGSGRSRSTVTLTVMTVDLGHMTPNIFADSLRIGQKASFSEKVFAVLESPIGATAMTFGNEFDDYYRVQIEPDTEQEILQIFEPDLMAKLIDQPIHFDFEITGGILYIYTEGRVASKPVLDGFIGFARAFGARFERETSNLGYSPAAGN